MTQGSTKCRLFMRYRRGTACVCWIFPITGIQQAAALAVRCFAWYISMDCISGKILIPAQVCARPVLHSDDLDFDLAISYLRPLDSRDDEPKRMSVLRQIARRNGCRMTSRWNTFVHIRQALFFWIENAGPSHLHPWRRCAVRSPTCQCWIPSGASGCTVHPYVPRKVTEASKARKRWGRMLDSDPEDDPPVTEPRPVPSRHHIATPAVPRPTSPKKEEKPWSGLLVRMKPDAPKGALKRVPRKPAPAPAKKVYSDGTEQAPRRAWLPREEWLAQRKKQEQSEDGFDIRVHGYWLTRSRGLVYRCPDGRELPATGVDAFGP